MSPVSASIQLTTLSGSGVRFAKVFVGLGAVLFQASVSPKLPRLEDIALRHVNFLLYQGNPLADTDETVKLIPIPRSCGRILRIGGGPETMV